MNKQVRHILFSAAVVSIFVFVGIAVNLNIYDGMMGTNYADVVNVIGWCLVPVFIIIGVFAYVKIIKTMKICNMK